MHSLHPVIALDLARERSRAIAAEAERSRLAAFDPAASGSPRPPRRRRARGAAASMLRTFAGAAAGLAASACRAAGRLEGDPA